MEKKRAEDVGLPRASEGMFWRLARNVGMGGSIFTLALREPGTMGFSNNVVDVVFMPSETNLEEAAAICLEKYKAYVV